MKVLHWLAGCGRSYSPGTRRRYRAVTIHSGIITRRLSEINMVISSGQNTMYDTHPAASPSTVSFSNHFHPPTLFLPPSLTHSAFLRLPTSATHLQITAALVIWPVISRNSFFFPSPLTPCWLGKVERVNDRRSWGETAGTATHREREKETDD